MGAGVALQIAPYAKVDWRGGLSWGAARRKTVGANRRSERQLPCSTETARALRLDCVGQSKRESSLWPQRLAGRTFSGVARPRSDADPVRGASRAIVLEAWGQTSALLASRQSHCTETSQPPTGHPGREHLGRAGGLRPSFSDWPLFFKTANAETSDCSQSSAFDSTDLLVGFGQSKM
jgi:hypothetical protein